jgi:formate hydrogenlyase subunit 6/NADH:ubiquinone oxidoreductase subunit I
MENKAAKSKKKAVKKEQPLKLNMTFEEALRKSITTKIPKKKAK